MQTLKAMWFVCVKKGKKQTNKQTYYTHMQHIVHTNNSFTSLEKLSLSLSDLENSFNGLEKYGNLDLNSLEKCSTS